MTSMIISLQKSGIVFFQEENRRSLAENNVDKLQKEAERYKGNHFGEIEWHCCWLLMIFMNYK